MPEIHKCDSEVMVYNVRKQQFQCPICNRPWHHSMIKVKDFRYESPKWWKPWQMPFYPLNLAGCYRYWYPEEEYNVVRP